MSFNKIVISEFLQVEELKDEINRNQLSVRMKGNSSYEKEHGWCKGNDTSMEVHEMFKTADTDMHKTTKKVSTMFLHRFVNHVWKYDR
jgi:hypothetical protein